MKSIKERADEAVEEIRHSLFGIGKSNSAQASAIIARHFKDLASPVAPDLRGRLFLENLEAAIQFHRANQNDPHNIDLGVMVAVLAVKVCYQNALEGNKVVLPFKL